MADMFYSSRRKVDRANKHIADIKSVVLSLPNRNVSSVEIDAKTGIKSIKHFIPDLPQTLTEVSLIAGDAIHNLRAALDYAWWEIFETFGPLGLKSGRHTKFPILGDAKVLEATLRDRKIDSVKPALFDCMFSQIKPYSGGNYLLFGLHELDISDKHKLLTAVVGYANINSIRVKDHEGVKHVGSTWAAYTSGDPFYIDFDPQVEIQDHGEHAITILFENPSPFGGTEIFDELTTLSSLVLHYIDLIEKSLL